MNDDKKMDTEFTSALDVKKFFIFLYTVENLKLQKKTRISSRITGFLLYIYLFNFLYFVKSHSFRSRICARFAPGLIKKLRKI